MKRLLHITDTHLYADPLTTQRGVITAASLAAVLEAADADSADLILISGDLCQDESREGYRLLRAQLEQLEPPIICLPGNHDALSFMREELAGNNVQVLGSTHVGDWRLLALDCTVAGAVHGEFGAERLAETDAALRAHPDTPTLVSLHHPPVTCGSRWLDSSRLADGDAFMSMLNRHAQVRAVLCGHIHQELDVSVGNIRVMATPSTCRQFAEHNDGYAVDDKAPGWRWLSLRDNSFDSRVERLSEQRFSEVMQ